MQLYGTPAGLVKKLEVRWFHFRALSKTFDSANEQRNKYPKHRMPFLHRTLSFARKAEVSACNDLSAVRVNSNPPYASKSDCKSDEVAEMHSPTKHRKKSDLLLKIFKHRVQRYNDELLPSPRRATRASSSPSLPLAKDQSETSPDCQRSQCVLEVDGELEMATGQEKNSNGKRPLTSSAEKDRHARLETSLPNEMTAALQNEIIERKKRKTACLPDASKSPAMSPLSSIDEAAAAVSTKDVPPMLPSTHLARGISHLSEDVPVSSSAAPETKLFLYYLFVDKDNVPACQVEVQENSRRCPFCFVDVVSSD